MHSLNFHHFQEAGKSYWEMTMFSESWGHDQCSEAYLETGQGKQPRQLTTLLRTVFQTAHESKALVEIAE